MIVSANQKVQLINQIKNGIVINVNISAKASFVQKRLYFEPQKMYFLKIVGIVDQSVIVYDEVISVTKYFMNIDDKFKI